MTTKTKAPAAATIPLPRIHSTYAGGDGETLWEHEMRHVRGEIHQ